MSAAGVVPSIAHDLNNALAPVVGFSEILRFVPGALDDRAKASRYLELIPTGSMDAAETVRRLREFYRADIDTSDHTPLNLAALARQAIDLTEPRWRNEAQASGRTISVQVDLTDDVWIAGNEAQLREALTNLIFNAVDATPDGGGVTIRTRLHPTAGGAVPALVTLEVQDTGAGMDSEPRRRCLDPFFTTKGERGTGLGLSMVHGIAQCHDGTLDIESTPGQGTTMSLSIPAIADAAQSIRLPPQRPTSPPPRFASCSPSTPSSSAPTLPSSCSPAAAIS